jgi:hypothetical protein
MRRLRGLDMELNAQYLDGTAYSNGVYLNFVRCISDFLPSMYLMFNYHRYKSIYSSYLS